MNKNGHYNNQNLETIQMPNNWRIIIHFEIYYIAF